MRILCQQTILMEYHALFFIFEKAAKFLNCRLLQNIGDALRVKGCFKLTNSADPDQMQQSAYHLCQNHLPKCPSRGGGGGGGGGDQGFLERGFICVKVWGVHFGDVISFS